MIISGHSETFRVIPDVIPSHSETFRDNPRLSESFRVIPDVIPGHSAFYYIPICCKANLFLVV